MKNILEEIKKLCTPAYIYLILSSFALMFQIVQNGFQNGNNKQKYCLGEYECKVDNILPIFIAQGLYIIVWTFILNAICEAGYTTASWIILFFPVILLAILLGILLLTNQVV